MTLSPRRLANSVLTFARGSAVGIVATLVDMAVLALLVELVGLSPQAANVPALLAGAVVQFLGCRHVVFKSAQGSVMQQTIGFALTEAGTLALNGLVFHLLVSVSPLPYAVARAVGTFVVFIGFSFPLWKRVFRAGTQASA
jgi:putative flippase GtrA